MKKPKTRVLDYQRKNLNSMIRAIKKYLKKHKPEDTLYRVIDDLLDEKERDENTIDLLRKQLHVDSTVYSPLNNSANSPKLSSPCTAGGSVFRWVPFYLFFFC